MAEINLFKIFLTKPEKQKLLERRVRVVSLVSLVAYCLVAAVVVSYWLYIRRKNESILEKIEVQKENIEKLKPVELSHAYVKQRLSALVAFWEGADYDFEKTLTGLEAMKPEGINITQVNLDLNGHLQFKGQASSSLVLAEFLDGLTVRRSDELVSKLTLESLDLKSNGTYDFSLEAVIGDEYTRN